jgi:hypothetical protein
MHFWVWRVDKIGKKKERDGKRGKERISETSHGNLPIY